MWLFTKYGFYSVVRYPARELPGVWVQVRARDVKHLLNLKKRFKLPFAIDTEAGTDYCCRMYMPQPRWLKLAEELAAEVDYTNFKNEAVKHKKYLGWRYVEALKRVWETMFAVQGWLSYDRDH